MAKKRKLDQKTYDYAVTITDEKIVIYAEAVEIFAEKT